MKKIIALALASSLLIGCASRKTDSFTLLGLGTPYQYGPEFMKGKVKTVSETIYKVKNENGAITKGEIVHKKVLDSLGYSHSFIANFDENGTITHYTELLAKNYKTY